MKDKKNSVLSEKGNPWSPQDEGSHYPMMKEWWSIISIFKTPDNKKKYSLLTTFAYEQETTSCFFQCIFCDVTSKKYLYSKEINDDIKKFKHSKNKLDLNYENSYIKGLFPKYDIHIESDNKDYILDFNYKAKSLPRWTAQDVTNGYLPIGLDYFRYGWLLNSDLNGSLKIKGIEHKISGKGYMEHAYGNWSYRNPHTKFSSLRKTLSIYIKFLKWWLSHHKPNIPDKIAFTSENNPSGLDWFWGVSDNEWSIFYGNVMGWISEGPALGVLTITPDGKKFWDFCNLQFRYNKMNYNKKYDFYYPTDMEIKGNLDDKKIDLRVWKTAPCYEYIDPYTTSKFYRCYSLLEMPAKMKGTFYNGKEKIEIQGDAKMAPQRQASFFGHNSLSLEFLKPPKGFGITIDFNSHYLNKKIFAKMHLVPHPKLKFIIEKIKN